MINSAILCKGSPNDDNAIRALLSKYRKVSVKRKQKLGHYKSWGAYEYVVSQVGWETGTKDMTGNRLLTCWNAYFKVLQRAKASAI